MDIINSIDMIKKYFFNSIYFSNNTFFLIFHEFLKKFLQKVKSS